MIKSESYMNFEDWITKVWGDYEKRKMGCSDLLKEIGLKLNDKNSILYQAAKKNVPIFLSCN